MSNQLSGIASLAYQGTRSGNPPNLTYQKRSPVVNDWQNFSIGDIWINTNLELAFILVSLANNQAVWAEIQTGSGSNIESIEGDVGVITPTNNAILLTALNTAGNSVEFVGSGSTMKLAFSLNGNTFLGLNAGNTSAFPQNNTSLGVGSLENIGSATYNLALGYEAGTNYTGIESDNILLMNSGTVGESNVIRIGTQGTGSGQQNANYQAGIYGVTPSGTLQSVIINSSGQLGSVAGTTITTINVQTFTASGTYTPTAGMQYCVIEVVGGGGGAGGVGASAAGTCGASSGGAGGGYSRGVFSAATIGASQTVTVGAGGTGGAGTLDGTGGGTSSVGALISATGGTQGFHGAVAAAGLTLGGNTPGIGSGGQLNLSGNPGLNAWSQFISGTSFYLAEPGKGGSSVFGGGGGASGLGSGASGQEQGQNGSNYGGGGGGGVSIGGGTAITGGNGANGVVIITEYIS